MSIHTQAPVAMDSSAGTIHRKLRVKSILHGAVSALATRCVGIAVSMLSVPLTIGYLGKERYAVWTLISSLLAWLNLADLGIGKGLTNAIAKARGMDRDDVVRTHISTAITLLGILGVVIGAGLSIAWPYISWDSIFNVKGPIARAEAGPAMAAAVGLFVMGFPLSVLNSTLTATQNGKILNYGSAVGNVLGLVALVIVTHTHGGLVKLVLAVSGVSVFVRLLLALWVFSYYMPKLSPRVQLMSRTSVRELMSVGGQFFLIQILSLIVFQTDNLMVAHYSAADQVPSYSVTYKLFEFTTIAQSVTFGYLSVAYTDAIARRDYAWVRRSFRILLPVSVAFTGLCVVIVVPLAHRFISLWTRGSVDVPGNLTLWMAGWSIINAFCSPIACLLSAASRMKAQLAYSALSVTANIPLTIELIRLWGPAGAVAGTVISYLVFICGPALLDAVLLLRRLGA